MEETKITLKQTIQIDSISGMGKILMMEDIPELVSFLEVGNRSEKITLQQIKSELGIEEMPDIVIKRTIETLKTLGLIDNNGNITSLGKKCLEIKRIPTSQEGLFRLWVIKNYKEIIHIQRKKAGIENETNENYTFDFDKEAIYSSLIDSISEEAKKNEISDFMIKYINDASKSLKFSNSADLCWEWKLDFENDKYEDKSFIRGKIRIPDEKDNNKSIEANIKNKDIKLFEEINLQENFSNKILPNLDIQHNGFDDTNKAIKIKFENIKNPIESILQGFIKEIPIKKGSENINLAYSEYFKIESIENIPIMPADNDDAKKWYNSILRNNVEDYISPKDFKERCNETINRKYFKSFDTSNFIKGNNEMNMNEFLAENRKEKINQWYFKAPLDLNIDESNEITPILEIKSNEKPSVEELINRLNIKNLHNGIDFVCFFDGYIINQYQIKIIELWISELGLTKDNTYLFTLRKKETFSGDKEKLRKDLKKIAKEVFFIFEETPKDYHDRYLWIKYNDDTDVYFKLSNSFGFMKFNKNVKDINKETKCDSNTDVSFNKVEKDIFPSEIRRKIDKLEENKRRQKQ